MGKITRQELSSGLISELDNKTTATIYTGTLTTSWTGATAPFSQTITVTGIVATDEPIITPIYSTTIATAILEQRAWNMIGQATTDTNSITFICFEDKPLTAISIRIQVIK